MGELTKAALARLNPEQRLVLMGEAVREGERLTLRSYMTPARRCALQRRGILVDRMYSQDLTPLGEQVREYLLAERSALTAHPDSARGR